MEQNEPDDVLLVGWLRGDDYEAALAYRRADRALADQTPEPAGSPGPVGSSRRPDRD